jgi:mannose-1-phosphate guanylyltransferase/mannose-6-phosphate isomerase
MSRQLKPKQLLPLVSHRTMLQSTVQRLEMPGLEPPLVICNAEHRFIIAEQLRSIGVRAGAIFLEPEGRNTAPAATVAALALHTRQPDGHMLLLPSDHVIADVEGFHRAIRSALAAASQGLLVTFGIAPSRPETGYGYIRCGDPLPGVADCYRVARFVEKPDAETAAGYLAHGGYYWNSGMFFFPVGEFLREVERLHPDMLALCRQALDEAQSDLDFLRLAKAPFECLDSISVDYAVMEHTAKAAMVPVDIGWSDVGSWTALWEISEQDKHGNVAIGDTLMLNTRRSYVRGERQLIATLGVADLIIVATADAVLVAGKDSAQDVKVLVDRLSKEGRSEHRLHAQVFRPWGWYQSIHNGNRFQVKEIVVQPGQSLSAQMHHHRAEHWIVVSGTARVTRGNETFYLTEDQSTYIPHTTPHRLENPGKIPLKMIEVQSGPYLGEDDIVRFDDNYGRTPAV